ncbi:helix-turn-helix domain-containing protein [Altererythrobacter xixiisoli]|uniref:Helix-turn-helix domain-containing protein n=1 Tax=Croceibacterium xixiisoli TaxID=1476466 RepID=A0A6I4TXZ2_9SPHN|nr:helix-turn-helix domain-containing protein [Croceibacterium xixiisoli]MXP00131.1 helix-turn-helix domain-containing protein [Croceibacterium xixiisoli]
MSPTEVDRSIAVGTDFSLDVRLFRLSPELQPYFTALYCFDIDCPDGQIIKDCLHPEWAAMRFSVGKPPMAAIGPGPMSRQAQFVVSGPTCQSIRFGLSTARIWGLGVQPAGWAKFIAGSARDFADRTVDGVADRAFALFAPLLDLVHQPHSDAEATAGAINSFLMPHANRIIVGEEQILACHAALLDPEIANVGDLGERLGMKPRTLERLCGRYFGFPPKMLLRRQRFLRSLARFMLEPRRNWSEAMDGQYYDQAQFVRDFRSFMAMTPSEYALGPHPILDRIIEQRMADQGAAPQTDKPTILRYADDGKRSR